MDHIPVRKFSFRRKGSSRKKNEENPDFDYEKMSFVKKETSNLIYAELLNEYMITEEQILELYGYSSASAVTKMYSKEYLSREKRPILMACGPSRNGAIGLICARHLKLFGYRPTIYFPISTSKALFKKFLSQCEKFDIPFLCYLPSDSSLVANSYNVIVDALIGSEEECDNIELNNEIDTLMKSDLPIVSIDVPSGWVIDSLSQSTDLQPELLISLSVAKYCCKYFKGKAHYLVGRFIPNELVKKFELKIPPHSGFDTIVEIKTNQETNGDNVNGSESSSKNTDDAEK